jgi:hypothetical protein
MGMWIRAGRILQRIDDMARDQIRLDEQGGTQNTRITRLEDSSERRR